jgi:hypothetical protein
MAINSDPQIVGQFFLAEVCNKTLMAIFSGTAETWRVSVDAAGTFRREIALLSAAIDPVD